MQRNDAKLHTATIILHIYVTILYNCCTIIRDKTLTLAHCLGQVQLHKIINIAISLKHETTHTVRNHYQYRACKYWLTVTGSNVVIITANWRHLVNTHKVSTHLVVIAQYSIKQHKILLLNPRPHPFHDFVKIYA